MDVIASCAFATKTNAIKEHNNQFIQNCRRIFDFKTTTALPALMFPKWLNRLIGVKTIVDHKSNDWIIDMTRHVVERRKGSPQKNNDFLQLLIDAEVDDKRTDVSNAVESHYILQGMD